MEKELTKLQEKAYAPYSNVKVAAIVITNDDQHFYGVNIENVSFTPTICAERNAIFQAINAGYRKNDFKEIHIQANSKNLLRPCGVCLQVMSEFFSSDTKIYLYHQNEKQVLKFSDLMPLPIDQGDLN